MSSPTRGAACAGLTASLLLAAPAWADPPAPPAPPPAAPPAAAPPAAAPARPPARPRAPAKPRAPAEPELPDAQVRLVLTAPSAQGLWTMRIANEGPRPVRVPADARLLQLTVEGGDTLAKKRKPVTCKAPAGLRSEGFPDARSLLLASGDVYTETFDPRLLCFGKDGAALTGGAIVRARLGWDGPKGAKKVDRPLAVESTEFPAAVAPQKNLTAPTLVLSYQAPEVAEKPEGDKKDAPLKDDDDKDKGDKGKKDEKQPPVVDENAPRFDLVATPFVDAANGYRVTLTVTATNVGHRPALVAMRNRMVAFRVEGPDGVVRCHPGGQTRSVAREGYRSIAPKGSASLTLLVEEACGHAMFRRPGLYRITTSLHLVETGVEQKITAYTGVARAKETTLVRVHTGPEPYHATTPKSIHVVRPPDPEP